MLDQLEEITRRFIIDICAVMYQYGYSEVSLGHVMRLIGVNDETASKHDDDMILLDENFEKLVSEKTSTKLIRETTEPIPPGTTLQ